MSAGRSGLGGLGEAATKAVKSADWKSIDFTLLYPDRPQSVAVVPYSSESILRVIVLACAQGPNGRGTSSAAAHGTAAGVKAALDLGVQSLAIPLLGAGVIGLPTHQTAMLNVRAALETLTEAEDSGVRHVIFFGQYEREINAIVAAWEVVGQKYRKSADDVVPKTSGSGAGFMADDNLSAEQNEFSSHAAVIVERAVNLAPSATSYAAQESSFLFLSALVAGRDGECPTVEKLVRLLAQAGERTEHEVVEAAGAALKVPVPDNVTIVVGDDPHHPDAIVCITLGPANVLVFALR